MSIPDFLDQLRHVFPHLYAIEGDTYLDLHNAKESYAVMYRHILHMQYSNIVGSFDLGGLENFFSQFQHTQS
jgi:hypothetical protein